MGLYQFGRVAMKYTSGTADVYAARSARLSDWSGEPARYAYRKPSGIASSSYCELRDVVMESAAVPS